MPYLISSIGPVYGRHTRAHTQHIHGSQAHIITYSIEKTVCIYCTVATVAQKSTGHGVQAAISSTEYNASPQ